MFFSFACEGPGSVFIDDQKGSYDYRVLYRAISQVQLDTSHLLLVIKVIFFFMEMHSDPDYCFPV